jgi:hypothetical protein
MGQSVQASQRKIPILIDAEKKRDGLDELLNFASYVVCSAKFPQVIYSPRQFTFSADYFLSQKSLHKLASTCINVRCLRSSWLGKNFRIYSLFSHVVRYGFLVFGRKGALMYALLQSIYMLCNCIMYVCCHHLSLDYLSDGYFLA